ncbi:Hypothetical predicted protein [Podarcis lilfordi]|uniref:Uncharacterized protein n=1 Tax=Podarcis lilfordi TaxID=74358 RepID=A0AA35LLS0_9SAUR|nr:Hypothetical predicted protein [Podarcis lilfordi]
MSLLNDGILMEDFYDPEMEGLDSFYQYPYCYRPRQRSCYYPRGYGYGYGYGYGGGYGSKWRPGYTWQYPQYCPPQYYGPGRWPCYYPGKRWPC